MAASSQDQLAQLKSLIDDLEQRRQDLRLFDGCEEINSHCDDLIGQVTLTVESAMDHLNKVQDRMINEINDYRRQLLEAQDKARNDQSQSTAEKGLRKLSNELEIVKSNKLPHDEASELAKSLLDKANNLRKKMRAQTFGGEFLRLIETDFMESDIIGRLEKTKKDVQDDFAIKHLVLDEMVASTHVLDLFSSDTGKATPADVTGILFLRNGNLAVRLEGRPLLVWDPVKNTKVTEILLDVYVEDFVTSLAQLPSGHLVIGRNEGSIEIWDLETRECKFDIGSEEEPVLWLKALPNGRLVVFGRAIRVWDLSSLDEKPTSPLICFEAQLDLNWFDRCHDIDAWNTLREEKKCYLSKKVEMFHDRFDHFDDDLNLELRVHMEMLWDDTLAYSYLLPPGPTVVVWDPSTGEKIKVVSFKAKDTESCLILPNGDVVLCRANDKVEIYSLKDKKMHTSFKNDKGPIVAIRMQTKHSLTFVHLKDPAIPILSRGFEHEFPFVDHEYLVSAWRFSDGGKQLAIGSNHGPVVIWPIQN